MSKSPTALATMPSSSREGSAASSRAHRAIRSSRARVPDEGLATNQAAAAARLEAKPELAPLAPSDWDELMAVRSEAAQLREENGQLREANGQLREENGQLREALTKHKAEGTSLRAEIGALQSQLAAARASASGDAEEAAAGQVPAADLVAEKTMRAAVAEEEAAGSCTFYFVPVARLRASQAKGELTLPSFKELRQDLVRRTLTRSECYRAKHTGKILAVSHRWEHPDAPDTKGVQLEAILKHLSKAGSSVEHVWFECAAHASIGPRTPQPAAHAHSRAAAAPPRPACRTRSHPRAVCAARQLLVHAAGRAHAGGQGGVPLDAPERQPPVPRLLGAAASGHLVPLSLLCAAAPAAAAARPQSLPLLEAQRPRRAC